MRRFVILLFVLITLAISLEYKYHNAFRQASKRMTPSELVIPAHYEKRIVFHPSDWMVPLLLGCVLFAGYRAFSKEMGLALALPLFAALSIAMSPWWHYPILYFHLWQLLTMVGLFLAAALLDDALRQRVLRAVLTTLVVVGTFQALVAVTQYFTQHSLGLRWLGEPPFDRVNFKQSGLIQVPDGCLWILDRWLGVRYFTDTIVRPTGTLCHTNVLGGFLMMTSLVTLSRFAAGRRWMGALVFLQLTALTLTFSRAALFAFGLGLVVWLLATRDRGVAKRAIALTLASMCVIGFCFQEQIVHRGGVVNYNNYAKHSDAGRVVSQNVAFTILRHKPLCGLGFEQYGVQVEKFLPPHVDVEKNRGAPHNIYLLWATETGLPSLACALALFAGVAWIGWQRRAEPHVACLLGVLVGFAFIGGCDFYLLAMQSGRLMLFLVAGLIAAHRVRRPLEVLA